MQATWESDLATLLTDLSTVQDEVLAVISKKRDLLLASDTDGLAALAPQEAEIVSRLQECLRRREELLAEAKQQGLPSASIKALTKAIPRDKRGEIDKQVKEAGARARLLQLQSFSNWVVIQRTLIHLSQLLEIIATGGRLKPTYGEEEPANSTGSLVDRAA